MLLQASLTAVLLTVPILADSQSLPFYGHDSVTVADTASGNIDLTYLRPTEKTKIVDYVFDTFGPYPSRYGAKDAFRSGNYSLLAFAGESVALEFFYSGPHSLLSRLHLSNAHGAANRGPNH